jgi:ribosomal protein S12 methylthiotransferase
MNIAIISLGCAKNLIDSELFLGLSKKYGLDITSDLTKAHFIVINTCGFIAASKAESIDTIIEMLEYQKLGKKIIVIGCLVERYLESLKEEIPEVDKFIPIKDYDHLDIVFKDLLNSSLEFNFDYTSRIVSTPAKTAYLRIGEGCNNKCHYCAIPLIRGSYRSRTFESLMEEVEYLHSLGILELTIIAQDTTAYGSDLKDMSLAKLLDSIANLNYFKWIRVLYLYPDEITDDLIQTFKKHDSILNYFDIPIQHASNKLLENMNRRGSKEYLKLLINKIRNEIPNAIIRTTLIVGYPTETEKDFKEMINFVQEMKFEHLGAFTYSPEEDTVGFDLRPRVSKKVAERRLEELMKVQLFINTTRLNNLIGKTFEAIIDHFDDELNCYFARYYAQALDDVDGYIYLLNPTNDLSSGDFVEIEITGIDGYDLIGKLK